MLLLILQTCSDSLGLSLTLWANLWRNLDQLINLVGGDVNGSWKPTPAQLFTRVFEDALSPGMFRHSCTSQLIVNGELYSRPVQIFLAAEREAEAWPRTYHLAVQDSMSTDHFG